MRPIDLLNLARTSTSFHRILMSKQSCVAWRRSLRSVPDLPECPDDMSEPFYTALVFGCHCFVRCPPLSLCCSSYSVVLSSRHAVPTRRTLSTTPSGCACVRIATRKSEQDFFPAELIGDHAISSVCPATMLFKDHTEAHREVMMMLMPAANTMGELVAGYMDAGLMSR